MTVDLLEESLSAARSSAEALRTAHPETVSKVLEVNSQLIVHLSQSGAFKALRWLHDDAEQNFDYLTDITAVEYRDVELPLEVVYQIRSLPRRVDLRLKILLDPEGDLRVDSVTDIWAGADWLEREVWDMFGVKFTGHDDLRRILMWQTYDEGHPLRKSFPLRGHRSRSEQTRQALAANPEAHYTLEELSIAEAYRELPEKMKQRLAESGPRKPQ